MNVQIMEDRDTILENLKTNINVVNKTRKILKFMNKIAPATTSTPLPPLKL